jgi:hypothetical protein
MPALRSAAGILLFLCVLPCLGQVAVHPGASTLLPGRTLTFRALATGQDQVLDSDWLWQILDGGPGTLDPATGHFAAPQVEQPVLVKIEASCRTQPRLRGEARVLVLPAEPFDLVGKVLGEEPWSRPYSCALPFRDEATAQRFVPGCRVLEPRSGWQAPLPTHFAGYGIPFTLHWQPPSVAGPQLLTYQEGSDWVRQDVTGQTSQVITARGALRRFSVEALERGPGAVPSWTSHTQAGTVHLRGMVPFAGLALAEPDQEDGPGQAARFREPFGLAVVCRPRAEYHKPYHFLVSDPQSHVIRMVTEAGVVSTPWGQPGHPGHQDTSPSLLRWLVGSFLSSLAGPQVALFNRPTFLCAQIAPGRPQHWESCLVADSGNHAIRVIRANGCVATLAGTPGQSGHRDGSSESAQFNNPQGLAEGPDGSIYVADQGNGVVRHISFGGLVTTVAGSPGEFGSLDGLRSEARFTRLRGLAFREPELGQEELFVADGHAIRRISLPEGRVTTVLGVVDTPGFRDVRAIPAKERRTALLQPCLRDPCGLLATAQGLEIVDQGNHCVRAWKELEAALATTIGDPGHGTTRWGLMRDGMPVPPDDRFAALDAPRTLALCPWRPGNRIIATGPCLGEIISTTEILEPLGPLQLETPPATLTDPYVLWFQLASRHPWKEPLAMAVHYDVEFRDADGTLAQHRRGTTVTSHPTAVEGQFSQRGRGTVVIRCVTEQGLSAGKEASIEVR